MSPDITFAMPIATQFPDNPGIARPDASAIAIYAEFREEPPNFSSDKSRGRERAPPRKEREGATTKSLQELHLRGLGREGDISLGNHDKKGTYQFLEIQGSATAQERGLPAQREQKTCSRRTQERGQRDFDDNGRGRQCAMRPGRPVLENVPTRKPMPNTSYLLIHRTYIMSRLLHTSPTLLTVPIYVCTTTRWSAVKGGSHRYLCFLLAFEHLIEGISTCRRPI